MLTNLKIENVAVIEKADIAFENGLNILTGETGAGKSIVIDSINAVLGERTSKELVRDGAQAAKVSAFFENIPKSASDILKKIEVEQEEDGSLLITRTISADGRNSCRINGQPVTVSMLRQLGRELITICGQHDSQHLLQKESHIAYIDFLSDTFDELEEYRALYREIAQKKKELSSLLQSESDKQQRIDFLKYQINELESADIKIGEKQKLTEDKKRFANREKMLSSLYAAKQLIGGDENSAGISQLLYSLTQQLAYLNECGGEFEEIYASSESFKYELEDCLAAISDELLSIEDSCLDIDSIEERLDILYRLSRKYGGDEEEMLSYLEKIRQEYELIESSDERAQLLQQEITLLENELYDKASFISNKRKTYAKKFQADVMQELAYLDMPNAVFEAHFEETAPKENGMDEVEFLISANSGQAARPLAKIASGGELSRVMLAIRCVLSDEENSHTMIFDEIDTGVSGRAAQKIALKLRQVSKDRQVICVTHLAQIAAGADNHLYIEKSSDSEKTYTRVTKLIDDERIREIARIIGGDVITKNTLMSACELIDFANKP